MSQSYILPSPLRDQQDGGLSAESIFATCRRRYSMTPSEKSSTGGSISISLSSSTGAKRVVVSPSSSISIPSVRSSSLKDNHGTSSSSSFRFPKSSTSGQARVGGVGSASCSTLNLISSSSSTSGPVIAKRGSSLNLNGRARATSQSISSSGSSSSTSGYFHRYGSTSTTPSLSLSHSRTASRSDRSDVDTIASSTGFSPLGRSLRPFHLSGIDHDPLVERDEGDTSYEREIAAQKRSVSSMDIYQGADHDNDMPNADDSFLPSSNDGIILMDNVNSNPSMSKKTSISFQRRASRNLDKIAHLLGEEYEVSKRDTLTGKLDGNSTVSLSSPTKSGFKNFFSSMRVKSFKKEEEVDFGKSIEEKLFRFGNSHARKSEVNLPSIRRNVRDTFPATLQFQRTPILYKGKEQDIFDDVFIIAKKRDDDIDVRSSGALSVLDETTIEEEEEEEEEREGNKEQILSRPRLNRGTSSRGERLSWLISADDSFLRLNSEGKGESYCSDISSQSSPYSTIEKSSKMAFSSSSSDTGSNQLKRSHSIDALYAMLEPWSLNDMPSQDRVMSTPIEVATTKPLEIRKRAFIPFEKSLPALPEVVVPKVDTATKSASTHQDARKQKQSEMDQSIDAWCKDFSVFSSDTFSNRRQGRNLEHIDVFSNDDEVNMSQLEAIPNALDTIMDTLSAELVYIARVRSKPLSSHIEMIRQRDEYSMYSIKPDAAMHRCALAALESGLSFQDDEDQVKELLGLELEQETCFNSAISVGCGLKEVGRGNGGGTEGWVLTVVCNAKHGSQLGSESSRFLMKFTRFLAPLLLAQEYQDESDRLPRERESSQFSSPSPSSVFVTPRSSPVRSTQVLSSRGTSLTRRGTLSSSSSHVSAFSKKKLPPLASPPPTSPLPLLPDCSSPLQKKRPLSPSAIINLSSSHHQGSFAKMTPTSFS